MKRLICIILALMLVLTGCGDVAKSEPKKDADSISANWEDGYENVVAEHYAKGELVKPVQRKDKITIETTSCLEWRYIRYPASLLIHFWYTDLEAATKEEFREKLEAIHTNYIKCAILNNVGYGCALDTMESGKDYTGTYDSKIKVDVKFPYDDIFETPVLIEYIIQFEGVETIYSGKVTLDMDRNISYEKALNTYFSYRGIDIDPIEAEVIGTISKNNEEPAVEEEIANDTIAEEFVNVANDEPTVEVTLDNPYVYYDANYDINYYWDGTTLEVYNDILAYYNSIDLYNMEDLSASAFWEGNDGYYCTDWRGYAVQSIIDGTISEVSWCLDSDEELCQKIVVANSSEMVEYLVYAIDYDYRVGSNVFKGDVIAATYSIRLKYYGVDDTITMIEEFYK